MNGTQVAVLKQPHEVGLTSFLESHYGGTLEAEVSFEVLSNLPDQTLEGRLAKQEFSGLLILPDFPQRYSPRPVSVRLLDTASSRSTLAALVANCFLGAFPPVDLRAVCFERAMAWLVFAFENLPRIFSV